MQRGELLLTILLVVLIVAGVAYDSLRGADKSAEVIIAHSALPPFDATSAQIQPPNEQTPSAIANESLPNQSPAGKRLIEYINRASEAELDNLPGIGPVLAQRIIQKRRQVGRFDTVDDLLNISGIGKVKLEALLESMNAVASPTRPIVQQFTRPFPIPTRPSQIAPKTVRAKRPLNQITRDDLMTVPGIGEHVADEILKVREQKGGFHSWSEVAAVSGIGKKRLERIKEYFTLPDSH